MEFYKAKSFCQSIPTLAKKGGRFQRAAKEIDALLGRINREDPTPLKGLKTTNHGESRIQHCVKYDLSGACRLITVQHQKKCFLLFAADHDDCDKWLNANKGKVFGLNGKFELVEVDQPSESIDKKNSCVVEHHFEYGPLFERLDEDLYERVVEGLQRKVCRSLEGLTCTDESKLFELVESVDDETLKKALIDIFLLLIKGDDNGALRRAQLYLGDIIDLSNINAKTAIVDSDFLKKITPDAPEYPNFLRRFAEVGDYKDWMSFMHSQQEKIAFSDFNGPAKLLGVSGSGKTCIVVQRSIYLANKYPKEKVLVVTLNPPLAKLIEELVYQLADGEVRKRIVVKPFFSVCQELLHRFEPKNIKLYEDVTWKSGEHIDEIWREYYRCELNNRKASVMQPVHDSLISRGISAEDYIREEFDWIRSAFPQGQRDKYIGIEREGRTISLLPQQRQLLLKGLDAWEEKMRMIGVTDYLNISTALINHEDKIEPEYRCVLIDESQDFGNIEFNLARKLVSKAENDLFLCGDAAQKVSTKYQKLKEAGIELHGTRSKKITRNYRNSKEILEAANYVLERNMTEEMLISDDFEILDPEFASFSGAVPVLMEGESLEHEIASAIDYVQQEMNEEHKACIAIAGFTIREIELFANAKGLPVLNGNTQLAKGNVFLSDLEQTKGFEFDYMCVLNCTDGIIPNPHVPAEEHFRELSRLYVAMTRAKLELIVSFSNRVSPLFEGADDYICEGNWNVYLSEEPTLIGKPEHQAESVQDDLPDEIGDLVGEQFLYRAEAIGLSQDLIKFIREKVDGRGLRSSRPGSRIQRRIKWKTIGDLIDDITTLSGAQHKINRSMVEEMLRVFHTEIESPLIRETQQEFETSL